VKHRHEQGLLLRAAPHDARRRHIIYALVRLSLALLLCMAALSHPVAQAGRARLRSGAGAGALPALPNLAPARESDPRFGVVQAFQAARDASMIGARWERMTFWWKEMQPDGPRSWNVFATNHDRGINSEIRAGRKIAGVLINTPDWAAVDPKVHGASVPRGLYLPYNDPRNYWGHFVGLMAKHYAGRINDWIIWNEVDIPSGQWHTWTGSRADYARLVKVAYLAAKAANPHARIILFGDPYWYDHGAWFSNLLARLTSDPGARAHHDYFDAANLHLYSGPTGFIDVIKWYQATLRRYGIDKPIWVSETNATPYDDPLRRYPKAHLLDSMDDQASFMVDAFAIDLALGVQRIEVNRMVDGTDFAAGGAPLGLVRNNGTVRPAFYAYRTVSLLLSGVTDGSIAINKHTGVYMVTLHKPGALITVAWDQNAEPAAISVAATGATAMLYDKFDRAQRVGATGGHYRLSLPGATDNSNTADPTVYVVGGSPLILVQPA
jgi:hypothetical protein